MNPARRREESTPTPSHEDPEDHKRKMRMKRVTPLQTLEEEEDDEEEEKKVQQ